MPERHDEQGHRVWLHRYLANRSDSSGQPRADLWRQGLIDFVQLDVDASVLWSPIGPAPLNIDPSAQQYQGTGPDSGEVTDIAVDATGGNDQTIHIATNDGGIWSTTDGGLTWTSSMDPLLSLSMGAIAIDPANPSILYAGSGNLYDGGSAFTKGVGVYRSNDGGVTWSIVDGGPYGTIFAGLGINRIVVPAADTLLVATNKGLYRSVDGGANFGSNSPSFDNRQPLVNGFITCLLLDTAAPATTIYAGVKGVGVMKSTDAGVTFPVNLFSNPGAPPAPFGNLTLAQSQAPNNQTLLALVQIAPGAHQTVALYQSINGGTQWNPMVSNIAAVASVSPNSFKQTDYDLTVAIDPQNLQLVYVGFQQLWRSNDGGGTFQACTSGQVHWDTHVLTFSPSRNGAPTPVYLGTDGGIAKSTDGGTTWTPINGEIGSNLFRGIDIGKGAGNAYTYGGCQDTGTSVHGPTDAGTTNWHESIDGDGYLVAVDPVDPTYAYGFDDADFIKTTNGGQSWQATFNTPRVIGINLPTPDTDLTRAIALEQNGADKTQRVVYVGVLQDLYKSVNAGANFGAASILHVNDDILAITTTTADSSRVWVGVADGSVHYSADAGATWDQGSFQTQTGGTGPATGIAVDPTNKSRVAVVYAGLSGIHAKYRTKRVFLTTDNGLTWNDISGTDGNGPLGNLPDLPMHSVVFDTSASPPAIIVASDAGVMRSTDATVTGGNVTATWKIYGGGLPTVCCNSLAIDNTVNLPNPPNPPNPTVLRVGTYGRSCFEVTRPTGPKLDVESDLGFGVVAVGQSGTLTLYIYNCGDAALTVTGITHFGGSADFSLDPSATFPANVAPGTTQSFDLIFKPSNPGDLIAAFEIASNDAAFPTLLVMASGRGIAAPFPLAPRLATNPISQTGVGTVAGSADRTIPVQLFNVGTKDLHISAINTSGSSDFTIDPPPTFPITIGPGAETDIAVKYHPTGNGNVNATFKFVSDDPHTPRSLTVGATGNAVSGSLWPIVLVLIGVAAVAGGVIAYEELKK